MKEYPYIIPKPEDWPIARFYSDRNAIVKKLSRGSIEQLKNQFKGDLPSLINQAIYSEKFRVKTEPFKVDPPNEYSYWRKLESELGEIAREDIDEHEVYEDILNRICNRYAEEIAGDFVPKTFEFARNILSYFFKTIYNPFYTSGQSPFWGKREDLLDRFRIVGPMDHIRSLFDKGTVMILPTHFSNLDSILIGYGIDMMTGMPAFSYGAGLNLYDYELMAYYMSRLGAYKVDRRKKNAIYLQSLKQFSSISIQEGMNNIFFPGGTRSRSGMLEKNLKLGLMGTLIDAQNDFYLRNVNKKIIIVPLVVSYHFVFEAQSLIDQHLRREGKEFYINKAKPRKTTMKNLRFISRVFKGESNVTLSFGDPIDIFGNQLDRQGRSIQNNQELNIREYFESRGQLSFDHQRNMVYTRNLADKLVGSYAKENVVLTSHIVAFVCFQLFKKLYPFMDIYSLLTLPNDYMKLNYIEVLQTIDIIRSVVKRMAKEGKLKHGPELDSLKAEEIFTDAEKNLNAYHFYAPLKRSNEKVISEDFNLLYFYHNRLEGYHLDTEIKVSKTKSLKINRSLYS